MKILNLTTLALGFLLLNAACCKKDKLPPETQGGYYYFGCLVNGKVWLPRGVPFSSVATIAWSNKKGTYLAIGANKDGSQSIGFLVKGIEIKSNNVYILNSNNNSNATFEYKGDKGSFCYYQSSSKFPGELTITKYDTINKIVSGRFSFKAVFNFTQGNERDCDTTLIDISEGRFDLKYDIQP
jgi:hypothetical protein